MRICPICGKMLKDEQSSCPCGFDFKHAPQALPLTLSDAVREKKPEKNRRKAVKISIITVIVLCVISSALFFCLLLQRKKNFDPVIYISQGKILFSDAARPNAKAKEIADASGETKEYYSYSDNLLISEDNRLLLYPNNYKTADDLTAVYDLYLYSFDSPKTEPIKISEGVSSHWVNNGFDTFFCFKGEGKSAELYRCDTVGNETLIADNISVYSISPDGSKVIFETFENEIYLWQRDKGSTLISQKGVVKYINEDFTDIFYLENGKLIKQTIGGENAVIDEELTSSDYSEFFFADGKGYYTKVQKEYPISDFFVDDMAQKDKASGLSEGKLLRDEIRREMSDNSNIHIFSLYYYDGEKTALVSEDVLYGSVKTDERGFACAYRTSENPKFPKVKMSDYSKLVESGQAESLYSYIASGGDNGKDYFLSLKGKTAVNCEIEGRFLLDDLYYDEENQKISFTVYDESLEFADLYTVQMKDGKLLSPGITDEGIVPHSVYILPSGDTVYLKNNKTDSAKAKTYDGSYSLYYNGEVTNESVTGYHKSDYPVKNILFMCSYETDEAPCEYIRISEKGVISFISSVNIDNGAAVYFTEKGRIILADEMNGGKAEFISDNKVKSVALGLRTEEDTVEEGISSLCIPHHPQKAVGEKNYDWSEATEYFIN